VDNIPLSLYYNGKPMDALKEKIWWSYLGEDLQNLLTASFTLLEETKNWSEKFDDYSFVVFPAAKAYEGFLKKIFLDLGFITTEDYYGKHFRIGKALNPSLPKEIRREGVYDRIVKFCGGEEVAGTLWDTWRICRNLTFHWFPDEKNTLTIDGAESRLKMVVDTIDMSFRECKLKG
jgi:hypothetical protein